MRYATSPAARYDGVVGRAPTRSVPFGMTRGGHERRLINRVMHNRIRVVKNNKKEKKMRKKRIALLSFLVALVTLSCAIFAVACGAKKHTVTWQVDEHVKSVSIVDGGQYAETMKVKEGTELSFELTFDEGWEANSVKIGTQSVRVTNGVYKTNAVKSDVTIAVTSKKILDHITVEWAKDTEGEPIVPVYHVGDTVDPDDIVVTAYWKTNDSNAVTNYTITYSDGDAFSLGDTSFTVSYDKKSEEMELDAKILGLVTIDLNGGKLEADDYDVFPEGYTEKNGVISWEFEEPIEADIVLPIPTKLFDEEDPDSEFPFLEWQGTTDGKIKEGTVANVDAKAIYEVRLVEITTLYFSLEEDQEMVPYLIIEGSFKAAKSAYLFLYEGNPPPVELKGDTVTGAKDEAFTLKFDIRKLVDKNYSGKWMDIKFRADIGQSHETQEIDLNLYPANFNNLNDSIEFEYNSTKYQAKYETHDGGGSYRLLKLVYNTFSGTIDYKLTRNITLEERNEKPYLIVEGKWLKNENKADAEAALADVIVDMQNFQNWATLSIEDKKTVTVNDDFTFEIALCLDGITEEGYYIMHNAGSNNNFDPPGYDTDVELKIGDRAYSLSEQDLHGWGWGWTCVKFEFAESRSVIVEDDVPYFILKGNADGKTAEEIAEMLTQFDFEEDGNSSNKVIISADKITITVEDGIYTVKVDISELEAGKYWVHAVGLGGDVHPDESKPSVTANGKTYGGYAETRGGTNDRWTAHLLEVAEAN